LRAYPSAISPKTERAGTNKIREWQSTYRADLGKRKRRLKIGATDDGRKAHTIYYYQKNKFKIPRGNCEAKYSMSRSTSLTPIPAGRKKPVRIPTDSSDDILTSVQEWRPFQNEIAREIAEILNTRPRKKLGFRAPQEAFFLQEFAFIV